MTRDELIARTRQLIDEGDRLIADPSLGAFARPLHHRVRKAQHQAAATGLFDERLCE